MVAKFPTRVPITHRKAKIKVWVSRNNSQMSQLDRGYGNVAKSTKQNKKQ